MIASSTANGVRWSYGVAMVLALFTGFGNMPLYGRYYISDIPGFAWSGDFYANLYVHYISGAVLLALSVYLLLMFRQQRRRNRRLTRSGLARVVALCLALVTGIIMAVKNLPGTPIPFPLVAVLTVGHMGLAMVAAALFALGAIKRWPWATARRLV
jgi:membrane-associated PAP2 superfamily phosphatase